MDSTDTIINQYPNNYSDNSIFYKYTIDILAYFFIQIFHHPSR